MNPEAGRGKLYNALKALRLQWQQMAEQWGDAPRAEFEAQVWDPLDGLSADALRAMDQLAQLFQRIRQDCQGNPDTYF